MPSPNMFSRREDSLKPLSKIPSTCSQVSVEWNITNTWNECQVQSCTYYKQKSSCERITDIPNLVMAKNIYLVYLFPEAGCSFLSPDGFLAELHL